METTRENVTAIIEFVERRLAEAEQSGIHLKIVDHRLDDDWLYVIVVPSRPGERASEYARYMSQVERELRDAGHENVLLMPALED